MGVCVCVFVCVCVCERERAGQERVLDEKVLESLV